MRKLFALALATLVIMGAFGASMAADWAQGMVLGFGEKLTAPQQSILKVQLGASTQSGTESQGEAVEPVVVSMKDEASPFTGLLDDAGMGPKGVSGAFVKGAEQGAGIWVTSSNCDYVPVVYANAFYTAGMRDAVMSLSSAEPVRGMMVFGVAIKAYEKLKGTKLDGKDVKLAAEEMLLTAGLGDAIGHMEMAAEVVAYAKELAAKDAALDAATLAGIMRERLALYEREADEAALKDISAYVVKYAKGGKDRSDMPAQLATLRAEQLWLVEPKERMVDEQVLAEADKELQDIIGYLEKEQVKQSFYKRNSSWLMPVGLVVVAAALSILIAYIQTRPKKTAKKQG
ncbi:MAG TPA: DUF1002 domain-containing protein [Bacillota bacterium]|nr:DUF1002 domain-containing protein [Bacillota bacterium]